MKHFFDFNSDDLSQFCGQQGMPAYVAAQLMDWVYKKGVIDPQLMTNIAARNRAIVAEHVQVYSGRVVRHQIATDETQKLLIDWSAPPHTEGIHHGPPQHGEHGEEQGLEENANARSVLKLQQLAGDPNKQTECVLIPTEQRRTACISSQIGCPVGCRFCASGIGGLDGNLRAGQIVEQVHRLAYQKSEVRSQRSEDSGPMADGARKSLTSRLGESPPETDRCPLTSSLGRITNVVFMGMGEPLANFGNVTQAIRTINAPWGCGVSARKITVSTVGLPDAIRKLVDFELPVTLALSLHAPNDEIRRQLIPWANYATIEELLDACDEYFRKSGREITLEYLLLRRVNDRPEHARELADLAKRLRANVNLIRYNEVGGLPFDRPTTDDVLKFQQVLRERGVNAHLRASRGRDIAAACGQLRHEHRETAAR